MKALIGNERRVGSTCIKFPCTEHANGQETYIGDRFAEVRPSFLISRCQEVLWVFSVDKADFNPQLRKCFVEQCESAAIERLGRHDIVSFRCEVDDAVEDGCTYDHMERRISLKREK